MSTPRFVDSYDYKTKLVLGDGYTWNIYGHPNNLAHFVTTTPVAASDAAREMKQGVKKSHTRRRYVGDPSPITVAEHNFDYIYDPGRKVGSATPGWSFILDDGTEKRQFTTTGDVQELVLYLETEVKKTTRLYTGGASTVINPADTSE